MRGTLLSILAIYEHDSTIFDHLELPTSAELNTRAELISPIEELDKDLLIGNICTELAELSLVYSDPDVLKKMIDIWSRLNHRVWLQLWETLLYKYNPIWNKDGTIRETREGEHSGTSSGTLADTTSGTDSRTGQNSRTTVTDQDTTNSTTTSGTESGTESGSRTIAHNVTGYDTNSYSPDTQDAETSSSQDSRTTSGTAAGTGTNDVTVTENGSFSESGTSGGKLSRETSGETAGTDSESLERIEQGNIGVTTTQSMIREQREIVEFNIYHYITESFKERFCVMVY